MLEDTRSVGERGAARPGLFTRRRAALAIVSFGFVCAILLVFSFFWVEPAPWKFQGTYDMKRYFAPNAYFLDRSIDRGELPLWNPLVVCGTPFAANPQTQVFYPPNLVRSLLTWRATPAGTYATMWALLFVHFLFAAWGTLLHDLSYDAAAVVRAFPPEGQGARPKRVRFGDAGRRR